MILKHAGQSMTDAATPFRQMAFDDVRRAPLLLSVEQVQMYNRDGYIAPLDLLSCSEVAYFRSVFSDAWERSRRRARALFLNVNWEMHERWIYELITNATLVRTVRDILGATILAWNAHIFCRFPGDDRVLNWHQDASYWKLTPTRAVTAWIALDDCSQLNGCMHIIPGSHRLGQIPYERGDGPNPRVAYQAVRDPELYGDTPVPINLKAGQYSLHSDLVLHGSSPNNSSQRRCGIAIRYIPPYVRLTEGSTERDRWVYACSGPIKDPYWHILEPPPNNAVRS